jgi:multiple sugar transport system permease protein
MGDAAAMSYVLTLCLIFVSIVVFWLFRERREKRVPVGNGAAGREVGS